MDRTTIIERKREILKARLISRVELQSCYYLRSFFWGVWGAMGVWLLTYWSVKTVDLGDQGLNPNNFSLLLECWWS